MYRYIFFDLDGTLTDSREGILNCVRYAIETLGGEVPEETTLLRFIGPPLQDSFAEVCGYDPEKAREAVRIFRERYVPIGQFENRPMEGAAALLQRLKARGHILALSSSKPEAMCESICGRFGFSESLAALTGSPPGDDFTKADVIRETMRRLGLTDEDKPSILMVGDRKFDVLGAAECGIGCVGVEFFGYAEPGELAEAGAVAVVQTVDALEQFILNH